jgi:hypothetical protein
MEASYDVAIVGYGPVGQVLAILLGQRGWKVGVFEKQPTAYPLPRAVHFDHEVARILQAVGLGAELPRLSEPADVYECRSEESAHISAACATSTAPMRSGSARAASPSLSLGRTSTFSARHAMQAAALGWFANCGARWTTARPRAEDDLLTGFPSARGIEAELAQPLGSPGRRSHGCGRRAYSSISACMSATASANCSMNSLTTSRLDLTLSTRPTPWPTK